MRRKHFNEEIKIDLSSFLALGLVACASGDTGSDTIDGTYSYQVTGYDWGAGVNKAVLSLDHKLTQIDAQDLKVVETKQVTDWSDSTYPVNVVDIDRTITDVYLCDADGNKVEGDSKFVAVEMYVSPSDGSPLLYSMATSRNTWSNPYTLTFTLADGATVDSMGETVTTFTVDTEAAAYTTSASMFEEGSYQTDSGETYGYVTYEPTEKSDTLFVWLHGGGEGYVEGFDVSIPVLANKVTALAGE